MKSPFAWSVTGLVLILSCFLAVESEPNPVQAQSSSSQLATKDDPSAKIAAYVAACGKSGFQGAISVAQAENELYDGAAGLADGDQRRFHPQTGFDIGSINKQFAAVAIVQLQSQGKLSVDDKLSQFFANCPADKANISIDQLLSHQSGLPHSGIAEISRTREATEQLILEQPLLSAPGEQYSYSDYGYTLISAIVERASGQAYRTYVRENIFRPLKLTRTGFLDDDLWNEQGIAAGFVNDEVSGSPSDVPKTGWQPYGAGLVISTAQDLRRWVEGFFSGDFLSADERDLLTARHGKVRDGHYYGYAWSTVESADKRGVHYVHTGADIAHNAAVRYYPDHRLAVAVGSNRINTNGEREIMLAYRMDAFLGYAITNDNYTRFPPFDFADE